MTTELTCTLWAPCSGPYLLEEACYHSRVGHWRFCILSHRRDPCQCMRYGETFLKSWRRSSKRHGQPFGYSVSLTANSNQLLSKNPDSRYQSAYGLKADLLECQKRLSIAVSSMSEVSSEVGSNENQYQNIVLPNLAHLAHTTV